MLIAVIGGKLQGVEAVYLAQKAGWKTLVIDKDPDAPATGLCDLFLEFKFSPEFPIPPGCPHVDLILPAIEDIGVLNAVKRWAEVKNIPLAFDLEAYTLTSSKLKSDLLFRKMNLPAPVPWPGCSFPVVVKPDKGSGSLDVEIFHDSNALFSRFPTREMLDTRVIQEYVEGSSHSIEIIGQPGNYQTLQVTDLSMDKGHDCKRVTAPTQLSPCQINQFEETALAVAEEIDLKGIMDVEVILNKNELKLLEIDARFPSQTPIAVYWSTGLNMVDMLSKLLLGDAIPVVEQRNDRFVVVEHIRVSGTDVDVQGEHIMAGDGPLSLQRSFFGSDEAITSYEKGKHQWVATLIFTGSSHEDVTGRRQHCYEQIRDFQSIF